MSDEMLTLREASEMAGMPLSTLQRRVKEGVLEGYASPLRKRDTRVRRSDLEALMELRPIGLTSGSGTGRGDSEGEPDDRPPS